LDYFNYRDGILHAEDIPLPDIAEEVGTPVYIYSAATFVRHYRVFADAFQSQPGFEDTLICYSAKANGNLATLALLAREGAGVDVVSEGELRKALRAGVSPEKIVFSGVGKTTTEMAYGLKAGILQFNVESEPELQALSQIAQELGQTADISLRINPDVDANTHAKISTGRAEDKFGVPWSRAREIYAYAAGLPGLKISGMDAHIGSQLTELAPFKAAFQRLGELVHDLRSDGHEIKHLDLGGGLGIPYGDGDDPPLPTDYAGMVMQATHNLGCRLIFEPGRLIAGNSGILLSRVIYVKEGEDRKFLILDAAMNDLIRPAMYDAYHTLVPVAEPAGNYREVYDIVGPVCESSDTFAKARSLTPIQAGDLVAFRSAGAYGAVMASEYNGRPLVPEVMVHGDKWAVIRPRPDYDELLGRDRVPDWLSMN